MAKHVTEFIAYVTEPPRIEISGGVAHVTERSGNVRIERAMSVRNLQRYCDRINQAVERYAKGEQDVVVES